MNIVKGLNRIVLVIAIIAIPISFYYGGEFTNNFKTVSPEYKAWQLEVNNKINKLVKEFQTLNEVEKDDKIEVERERLAKIPDILSFELVAPDEKNLNKKESTYRYFVEKRVKNDPKPPDKYKYPPVWACYIGAIISAFLGFAVVLFGLRGIIRLFVWIGAGFKD